MLLTQDIKKEPGYKVAERLWYQRKVFNCSLDEAWEKHIHAAIHHAHNKEYIIELAEKIEELEKEAIRQTKEISNVPKISHEGGYYCDYDNHHIRLVKNKDGKYQLKVFKDGKLIYTHTKVMFSYPFSTLDIKSILRSKLDIHRFPANWVYCSDFCK